MTKLVRESKKGNVRYVFMFLNGTTRAVKELFGIYYSIFNFSLILNFKL